MEPKCSLPCSQKNCHLFSLLIRRIQFIPHTLRVSVSRPVWCQEILAVSLILLNTTRKHSQLGHPKFGTFILYLKLEYLPIRNIEKIEIFIKFI